MVINKLYPFGVDFTSCGTVHTEYRLVNKTVMGTLASACSQISSTCWLMGFMVGVIPVELAPTRLNT